MNNILILPCSRWESSSSSLVKSGAKALASRHIKITRDMFILLRTCVLPDWSQLILSEQGRLNLLSQTTRHHPEISSLMIRNDSKFILRIYKLWQLNHFSHVTDCLLKLLLHQVLRNSEFGLLILYLLTFDRFFFYNNERK